MPQFSRRQFAVLLLPLLAGCAQGGSRRVALDDISLLATDALLVALLRPAENRMPLTGTPEPPLLIKGAKDTVLLSTDYAAFVRESRGAIGEAEVKALEAEVAKRTGKILEKEGFILNRGTFGVAPDTSATGRILLATFTPATETGGSPSDKRAGKNRSLLLIRLTITDPAINSVLRVREFYSGRDVGVRP